MIKKLAMVVVLAGALSGCATLDNLLGVKDSAPADQLPSGVETVIDNAESAGNSAVPGMGWVLGGILTIGAVAYRALRKKESE